MWEIQKTHTVEDEVIETTKEFSEVMNELCNQLKTLKTEQWELKQEDEKSTEFIDAYDLVIQNKVWIFHKIVDAYAAKMRKMTLFEKKKEEEEAVVILPEVSTNVVSYN